MMVFMLSHTKNINEHIIVIYVKMIIKNCTQQKDILKTRLIKAITTKKKKHSIKENLYTLFKTKKIEM